jgi:hypothetical protein
MGWWQSPAQSMVALNQMVFIMQERWSVSKGYDHSGIESFASFPELMPVFSFDLFLGWLKGKLAYALGELCYMPAKE